MQQTIKAILSLSFATILAATPAFAQEDDKTGFYVAPEVGLVKWSDYCGNISDCDDTVLDSDCRAAIV